MRRTLAFLLLGAAAFAQVQNFKPVTEEMLRNPSPNDWLSFSRTLDAQRFSPLNQINKANVKNLSLAWSRGLGTQNSESIPIVDRKSTRLNSSHSQQSRMPSSA